MSRRKTTKKEQAEIDSLKKSLNFKPQYAVCDAFTGEMIGAAVRKSEVSGPPAFSGPITDSAIQLLSKFAYDENIKTMRLAQKGKSVPVLLKTIDLKETLGYAVVGFTLQENLVAEQVEEYVMAFLIDWVDNMELIKYLSERKVREGL